MTAEPKPGSQMRLEVVDPNNVPIVFVDWIIAGGLVDGIVNMTLGTVDSSLRTKDGAPPRSVVATRLRCSSEFAKRLHAALGSILGLDATASEKGGAPSSDPPTFIN